MDIPREPRSGPAGRPPRAAAPRYCNAPGSPVSRCRTPSATSSRSPRTLVIPFSAGSSSRLLSLPAGAAVGLDGARASLGELPSAEGFTRRRARGLLALGLTSLGLLTGGGLLRRRLSLGC